MSVPAQVSIPVSITKYLLIYIQFFFINSMGKCTTPVYDSPGTSAYLGLYSTNESLNAGDVDDVQGPHLSIQMYIELH